MSAMQHIEALLGGLSRDELLWLIEHIAHRLRQSAACPPQPLYGIWKGKFPEDADIDATLQEVHQQWPKDFAKFQE